jgi:hypothetical protein
MNGIVRALLLGIVCVGCVDGRQARAPSKQVSTSGGAWWDTSRDTGLVLTLDAPADTIGPNARVEMAVLVQNWGPPRKFRNDPQLFHFEIIGPDGVPMPFAGAEMEPPSLGSVADVVLPRGGMIGQIVDLRCAAAPFELAADSTSCMWRYSFESPGEYRAVVRYSSPVLQGDERTGPPRSILSSDTIRFVVESP